MMLCHEYTDTLISLSGLIVKPGYEYRRIAFLKAVSNIKSKISQTSEITDLSIFDNISYVGPKIKWILESIYNNKLSDVASYYDISIDDLNVVSKEFRVPIKTVSPYIEYISNKLNILPSGSYRRRAGTLGDLDFICTYSYQELVENIADMNKHNSSIQMNIRNNGEKMVRGIAKISNYNMHFDIRVIDPEFSAPAMLYLTGSHELNIRMRSKAKSNGMKLSEYGLYNELGIRLDDNTEESIFALLDMKYIIPELR